MENIAVALSFFVYFLIVLLVGFFFFKRTETLSYYILGERSNNAWVTAISAQASDMSSWLLLGLPGAVYLSGMSATWIAIGLGLGTYLNWLLVAKRLRQYSFIAGDALTLPEFFSNRFKDDKGILKLICGVVIFVFITLYLASGLNAGGKLFTVVFPGMNYQFAVILSLVIVIIYTFLGGFKAVCWTDLFQGILMLIAIILVPLFVLGKIDPVVSSENLAAAGSGFLSIFQTASGDSIDAISVISNLAWGLGYLGMPYVIIRFMAAKDAKTIKISRRIATVWVVLALTFACLIGLFGRQYLGDALAESSAVAELVFIELAFDVFAFAPFIAGILISAVLAAIMSTADSQLILVSSAISNDISSVVFKKKLPEKTNILIGRVCIVVVGIIAGFLALDPNSSIMDLVKYAWGGFGASFGPVVLLSLFWRRMNFAGAAAGMITGFAVDIAWVNIPALANTGLYELVPAFILATIAIVVASLITKEPSKEITDDFDRMVEAKV